MWMLTLKLPSRRTMLLGALGAAAAVWLIFAAGWARSAPAFAVDDAGAQAALDCLRQFGWTVDPGSCSSEPLVLDPDTDADYQALQQEAGFDLTPYLGQTVTRYTFTVTNYPTGEYPVTAVVLVADGAVIGGDIHAGALNGFMHALCPPGAASSA